MNYFSTNVESNLAAGQHAANNHMKSNNSELAGPYSLEKSAGSSVYSSEQIEGKQANPQFHYEVPNLTSVLYEYTNREQD